MGISVVGWEGDRRRVQWSGRESSRRLAHVDGIVFGRERLSAHSHRLGRQESSRR